MRGRPMPPEIAALIPTSYLQNFFYKGSNEWAGPCPLDCMGGHDRFVIFAAVKSKHNKPHGWCRECKKQLWPESKKQGIDPEVARQFAQQREEAERKQKQRRKKRLEWLQQSDFWLKWHEDMTKEERQTWYDRGVGEWAILTHKLGYRNSGKDALTIPYLRANERIVSLQYRLLCNVKGGKYRFLKGMQQQWFYPWPEDDLKEAKVAVIAEGAIKAMVLWQTIGSMTYQGVPITIAATPSVIVPGHLFDELDNVQRVIWLLDPDAYEGESPNIARNIRMAGKQKSLHVRVPGKIDDLILDYDWSERAVKAMIQQAEPWIS